MTCQILTNGFFQNPQEQAERVLRFVGVSNNWKFEITPQRKHIVFNESGLKEAEEAMAQAYEEPNKELYRWEPNSYHLPLTLLIYWQPRHIVGKHTMTKPLCYSPGY